MFYNRAAWGSSVIIWSGQGFTGFGVLVIWLAIGTAIYSMAADAIHPEAVNSFSLTLITNPALSLILIATLCGAAANLWIWGRILNADGMEHTLYGFPMETLAFPPGLGAVLLSAYMLVSPPTDRAADDFSRACKANMMEYTYPQCECIAQLYSAALPPDLLTQLAQVSRSNTRREILEGFYSSEGVRYSSAEQNELTTLIENSPALCTASGDQLPD
jgi:hypothetical protein